MADNLHSTTKLGKQVAIISLKQATITKSILYIIVLMFVATIQYLNDYNSGQE